jgi:predicted transcriptional regulator
MRTFHLPMTDELHEALREEARAERRPATEILRDALTGWIEARRRQRIAEEIERFARAEAGTGLDLDVDLEAAGIDSLLAGQPQ